MVEIGLIIQGALAVIKILDELEAQGAQLTEQQRKVREEERARLNAAWAGMKPKG